MGFDVRPFGGRRRRLLVLFVIGLAFVAGSGLLSEFYPSEYTRGLFWALVTAFVGYCSWLARQVVVGDAFSGPDHIGKASDVLKRSNDLESHSFFLPPPAWTDFEEDFAVTHPLLETISEAIGDRRTGLLVIEGDPASGKSFLLNNLAYEQLKDRSVLQRLLGRNYYSLRLKRKPVEGLRDDFDRLPSNSVVFVDDVHLNYSELIDIADDFKSDLLLVFSTRPIQNYAGDQRVFLENLSDITYEIDADMVADRLIEKYLDYRGFSSDEIDDAKDALERYSPDLWSLSAAVETYGETGEASEETVYDRIFDMKLDMKDGIDRVRYLVPIACLYRFEIPVSRSFLTSRLDLSRDKLSKLVAAGQVFELQDGRYALHHSSVADLILEAVDGRGYHRIPAQIQDLEGPEGRPWEDGIVELYVWEEPRQSVGTLANLSKTLADGQALAAELITRVEPGVLAEGIDPEFTDVEELGYFFSLFLRRGLRPDPRLTDRLREYVQEMDDESVQALGWTTDVFARLDMDEADLFADRLSDRLETADPELIANVINIISYADEALAARIAEGIDPESIRAHLERGDYPAEVLAMTVAKMVWVSPEQFEPLAKWFRTVIMAEEPDRFPRLLCRIAFGNEESAQLLLGELDPAEVATYLSAVTVDEHLYQAVVAMYVVNPDFVHRLGTELDLGDREVADEPYRRAVTELLDGVAGPRIEAIQGLTSGPVHERTETESQLVRGELEQLSGRSDVDLRTELSAISGTFDADACLAGLLTLSEGVRRSMDRSALSDWTASLVEAVDHADELAGPLREMGYVDPDR